MKSGRKRIGNLLAVTAVVLLAVCHAVIADQAGPYATISPKEVPPTGTLALEIHVPIAGDEDSVGTPSFVHSSQFEFRRSGVSHRLEIVNGARAAEKIFSFQVSFAGSVTPGRYKLPAAHIPIGNDSVELQLPAVTVTADTDDSGAARQSGFAFSQMVETPEAYVGQQVIYTIDVVTTDDFVRANLGEVTLPDFARLSFGKLAEQKQEVGNAVHHTVREALFPLHAGTIVIPGRTLAADLRVRQPRRPMRRTWDFFDDVFQDLDPLMRPEVVSRKFTAEPTQVHVKDLPPPDRALSGPIPVGDLSIHSRLDQKTVEEGSSVTLTIDIVSDGNLTPYDLPKPSGGQVADFKTYVDKPKLEVSPTQNRILFTKTFAVTFVPQRPGPLAVPVYPITYFNPRQGKYITLSTTNETIQVTPRAHGREQVVMHGGADKSVPAPQPEQQEVVAQGEDLLPQHIGASLRETERAPSRGFTVLLLIGLPLLTFAVDQTLRTHRRRLAVPDQIRAAGAFRAAQRSLQGLEIPAPADLLAIVRAYIGARFALPAESFTSADIPQVFSGRYGDASVAAELGELLGALQSSVYGGREASDATRKELAARTERCIEKIEALVNKR